MGTSSNWVPPAGYGLITAVLKYDQTIVPAARVGAAANPWKVLFKKGTAPKLTLPKCGQVGNAPPCLKQAKVLASGDLRVKVFINSDPKLATRR